MFDPEPQSCSFCLAMTDEQIAELVHPFTVERIERKAESGKVYFRASFVERGRVQSRLIKWRDDWSERQPKKPPFDLERELRKIPEPDILEMNCDGEMKRYRVEGRKLIPLE